MISWRSRWNRRRAVQWRRLSLKLLRASSTDAAERYMTVEKSLSPWRFRDSSYSR
jgi:hypothetical protein